MSTSEHTREEGSVNTCAGGTPPGATCTRARRFSKKAKTYKGGTDRKGDDNAGKREANRPAVKDAPPRTDSYMLSQESAHRAQGPRRCGLPDHARSLKTRSPGA